MSDFKALTLEERKEMALRRLEQLNVSRAYRTAFKDCSVVTLFERGVGFFITADRGYAELEQKIRDLEHEYSYTVYAVLHEIADHCDRYTCLCVTSNSETEPAWLEPAGLNTDFYTTAYIWNRTHDECSELSEAVVKPIFGGLVYAD